MAEDEDDRKEKFRFDPNMLPEGIRAALLPHFRDAADNDPRIHSYALRVFANDPDTVVLEVQPAQGGARKLKFSMAELLVEQTTTGKELLELALST